MFVPVTEPPPRARCRRLRQCPRSRGSALRLLRVQRASSSSPVIPPTNTP